MADHHTIKSFTAADIERYHKGQLSAPEMHSLEKAALDDPFLADALEGYTVAGVNVNEDLAELKKRLSAKTEQSKIVPLTTKRHISYFWFRIAAMIILVGGAGFIIYQLGFNNNSSGKVAQSQPDDKKSTTPLPVQQDTIASGDENVDKFLDSEKEKNLTGQNNKYVLPRSEKASNDRSTGSSDSLFGERNARYYDFSPPKPNDDIAKKETRKDNGAAIITDSTSLPGGDTKAIVTLRDGNSAGVLNEMDKSKTANANNTESFYKSESRQLPRNIFRGRITDDNNNPLPFANVTNTSDNVGTYANAKGYFTLTSPDSVLNVQVRSVGFSNNNIVLRSDSTTNNIVMTEDNSSLATVVIDNNRNLNSSRSRTTSMVLEEPEPVDGWYNYDTYIANNLNIPETYRARQPAGGEVVISFEVDSDGEPINIKVEKSLCESCDKEAMRLVKEGPKFKRKAKKRGRTTVSVSF